jgi:hypothetical protein
VSPKRQYTFTGQHGATLQPQISAQIIEMHTIRCSRPPVQAVIGIEGYHLSDSRSQPVLLFHMQPGPENWKESSSAEVWGGGGSIIRVECQFQYTRLMIKLFHCVWALGVVDNLSFGRAHSERLNRQVGARLLYVQITRICLRLG